MAIRKQNRCPACGNVVDLAGMVYSTAADAFVCRPCLRAGTRPPEDVPLSEAAAPATPPTASVEDDDAALAALVAARMSEPPATLPASYATESRVPPAGPPPVPIALPNLATPRRSMPSWLLPAGVATVLVVTLAIVLVARGRPAADPRRAWDDANRERIIALKSQAEELTLANKLREAHAKYRELETLVGGHTIGDPRLFDLVDQARLDQSRVYRILLHSMSPGEVDAGPQPTTVQAKQQAAFGAPIRATPSPSSARATPSLAAPNLAAPAKSPAAASAPVSRPATRAEEAAILQDLPPVTQDVPPAAFTGPRSYNPVTDAQVEQAIRRGVDFLVAQFRDGQLVRGNESALEYQGRAALAVYALLQTSKAVRDERLSVRGDFLRACIEQLKAAGMKDDGTEDPPGTYARALRACALATYNRPEDRDVLRQDVAWLVNAQVDGAYWYDDRNVALAPRRDPPPEEKKGAVKVNRLDIAALRPPMIILADNGEIMMPPIPPMPPPPPYVPDAYKQPPTYQLPRPGYRGSLQPPTSDVPWDNSNSQYGALGVWAGAEVGVEVSQDYWKKVQQHWQRSQHASGQWSYTPGHEAAYSMTVGGVATLFVAYDYLEAPLLGSKIAGRKPYDDFLTAGLAYLESGDNVMDVTQSPKDVMLMAAYNLFALERVGLASGLKYIGAHDWYAELAAQVIKTQRGDGSWLMLTQGDKPSRKGTPDATIDTAYALLFLSRGRHPVMMNKLRFDGSWTNRPRDAANLAAYASREMERPVNWQVVDINRTADDWADSPILYLASNTPPKFGAEEVRKIREFVEAGGLLFTHADTGSDAFTAWASKLAKEIFPGQALENLSPQHPLYTLNYKIENPRPRLLAVDNGTRLLMIHSPTDFANAWQVRATESRKVPFQLGVNLYLYATGKQQFRNRLDTRAVPPPPNAPAPQYDIAQVRYDGNWNPEPGAWPRFCKTFQNNTGNRLVVHEATPAQLKMGTHIMAVITGVGPHAPTDAELAPTAQFVRDGGTLFVDACGGSGGFVNAIEPWLAKLDPSVKLEPMRPDDEFLKAAGTKDAKDIGPEQLRLSTIEKLGGAFGVRLKTAKLGKGRVIFTSLDVTSGLLGTNTWGVTGYLPEYSEALMQNVVMVTSARNK